MLLWIISQKSTSSTFVLRNQIRRQAKRRICTNPSLCLTANLISEHKCRGCGFLRDDPQQHASTSIPKRFKLADDYLFAPESKNPFYFQLMTTRNEQQKQREENQHVHIALRNDE